MSLQHTRPETRTRNKHFYIDWVLANASAEAIGIGAAALIAVQMSTMGDSIGSIHPLVVFIAVVLGGTLIEGVFVGLFQGLSIRRIIPVSKWTLYTAIGAGIAWVLGMLPSTLIDLFSTQTDVATDAGMTMAEMSPLLTLVLAAGMGLILAPFLAVPQWMLLRRYVGGATWYWIPVNMIAWAVGMMFIFASMDYMPADITPVMAGFWGAGVGAITGIIVGGLHGVIMNYLVQHRD